MPIPIATASLWPARCAYISAAIFTAASGLTNLTYGWQKGDTFATSLVWSAVAGAVAIVFALSWPALIRSVDARRWSAALISLVALSLSGTYSVTAALGSASGGRASAAATEVATTDARRKAQAAYDAAASELGRLPATRPVAELEGLLTGARPQCRIVVTVNRRDTICGPPAALVAELGRAKRRGELEAKMDRASAELASIQPARVANSDAKALARYLSALGLEVGADRLNDLLVLLAVVMIEAGGGLSLAIGMALGEARAKRTAAPVSTQTKQPPTTALNALNSAAAAIETLPAPVFNAGVQRRSDPAPGVQAPDIVRLTWEAGGMLRTTTRRLGVQLGRSAASVHGELRRLATAGLISLNADSRGTLITLAPAARPN